MIPTLFCVDMVPLIDKMHLMVPMSYMIVITSHMMVPSITLLGILNFYLFIEI
jgi:hypothetical protein